MTSEREDIQTNTTEIKIVIKEYYKKLYANKLGNLGEMDKFLEAYKLIKLRQEEICNVNGPNKEIESVIRKLPTNISPGADRFTGEF